MQTSSAAASALSVSSGGAFFTKASRPDCWPSLIASQITDSVENSGDFSRTEAVRFFKLVISFSSSSVNSEIPKTPFRTPRPPPQIASSHTFLI